MSVHGSLESIKPDEFARAGERLSGTVEAAALSRLRDQLAGKSGSAQAGQLDYAVVGSVTGRGHDALTLELKGVLEVTCQRCLEPVQVAIDSRRRIIFAADAEVLEAVDAEYDAEDTDVVEPVGELEVAALIEDEILLSLPLAPMHEPGSCQPAIAAHKDEAASPFAALAKLAAKNKD